VEQDVKLTLTRSVN